MNIPKAIKELEGHTPQAPPYFDPDFVEALKLSIEALKEYKRLRALKFSPSSVPLPGETEE